MPEAYICICGGEDFSIHIGFICCLKCQRRYKLKRFKALSGAEAFVLELPEDFNKKTRKEA